MMAKNMGWGIMEEGWRKGPWTAEEDRLLIEYVKLHGEGRWNSVSRIAGLKRNGKSCRLRWVNYLRPDLKRGQITPHEQSIIMDLHARWGNRWSTIARSLPGRTDNEIKNYWRTHFKKKGKPSLSESSDKARARLLKRQQFQKQQQQLQQNQVVDMKKVMSWLQETDRNNNNNRLPPPPNLPQHHHLRADNHPPCISAEEQSDGDDGSGGLLCSSVFNLGYASSNFQEAAAAAAALSNEDMMMVMWDNDPGLWSLDDYFQANNYLFTSSTKSGHHNLSPAPLS